MSEDVKIWEPNPGVQTEAWLCEAMEVFFGGSRGCVHPDTLLDTPTGPCKVKDWKGGEIFTLRNGRRWVTHSEPAVAGSVEDLFAVSTASGGRVICTEDHQFMTRRGWKALRMLSGGDEILCSSGEDDPPNYSSIISVIVAGKAQFWDVHVPETNCYFAEGILHHNCGKSAWLFGKVLQHVTRHRGRAKMIFFRENVDDLGDLIEKGKDMLERHGLADYIGGQTRLFRFKGPFDGATLKMRHLDHPDDLKTYKGHEYTLIGIDEICDLHLPFLDVRDAFLACLRNPHGIQGQLIYTGNPGGFNHGAVKAHFIDPWPTGKRILRNEVGQTRCFFQATLKDNPALANDPVYVAQLEGIRDPILRRAWRDGDWSVALGSMFGDVFSINKHVLPFSITGSDIPKGWPRFRALDWGSSTPFCVLWYFIANGEELNNPSLVKRMGWTFPPGAVVFYREYYGQDPGGGRDVGCKLGSNEVAKNIKRIEIEGNDYGLVRPGPADNQIFAVLDGTPIYSNFYKEGIRFVQSNKSPGSVAAGCELMRARFIGQGERPDMYYTRDCVHSIRTVPVLARDRLKPDQPAPRQEDHPVDVSRYVCLSLEVKTQTAAEAAAESAADHFYAEMMREDW